MLDSMAIQIFHLSLYSTTTDSMQTSSDITETHKSQHHMSWYNLYYTIYNKSLQKRPYTTTTPGINLIFHCPKERIALFKSSRKPNPNVKG